MKGKRLTVFCAAVASVLLCITAMQWFNRAMVGEIPRAHASGERLSFTSFRRNEQIFVAAEHGDRGVKKREYRFYWAAGGRHVDVVGNRDSIDYGALMETLVMGRAIPDADAQGLDRTVAYFRRRGEERSIGVGQYHLTYFRDNRLIGDEFFVGYFMPRQLAFFERERMRGQAIGEQEYEDLAAFGRVSRAELALLVPFESLEIECPEK